MTPEPISPPLAPADALEVSFVMPCLDEAETIERCVRAAQQCLAEHHLRGEVIVADNGSTDGSAERARAAGALVIPVALRGVGASITAGVTAARGRFVIMGDSDGQHDFAACFPFVERLRRGDCDLVMGSRFRGTILPGAMRPLNRYLGNPVLSSIGRILFRAPVSDFHCGLRAFPKAAFEKLGLQTVGFEFTTEHIAKTALAGQRIVELPITVHPAGRSRAPHLRPYRDGWRTLRFMLLLSPQWALIVPGVALMVLGVLMAAAVAPGPAFVAGLRLDVHTLLLGCLCLLVGYTTLCIGAAARIYAANTGLGPPSPALHWVVSVYTLERGILLGTAVFAAGAVLVGRLAYEALAHGLKTEEVLHTMRPMIIGSTLIALGVQTVLMSFFYSMLGVPWRAVPPSPPSP